MTVTANDIVTRVNPSQTAIASGSAVVALKIHLVYLSQEWSYARVISAVQFVAQVTRITQVTCVAQSKSALEVVSATGGWVGGTINPRLLMF